MDHENSGCGRRTVLGLLLIIGVMMSCGAISTVVVDRLCVQTFSERLPLYPGAQVVSERHNFLSTFGIGETIMILHSPDPVAQVKDWYSRTVGEYMYNAGRNPSPGFKLTRSEWAVDPDTEQDGSTIYLHGVCAG